MKNPMLKLQAMALSLMACALFSNAFAARTFSISEQTDMSVTFRFETPDGLDYSIYLASGVTDADDDKYGWDAFAKIGDVRRDDTSLTYEVSAELRDGRPLRFFLMQDANLANFTFSTYQREIIKRGTGTFTIKNNHTDQRMDGGTELFPAGCGCRWTPLATARSKLWVCRSIR